MVKMRQASTDPAIVATAMASALVSTSTPEAMRHPSSSGGVLSLSSNVPHTLARTPTSRGSLDKAVQAQRAVDHDSIPLQQQQQQQQSHGSNHEHVLQTPRRGRRLAGVDLGWDSPPSAESTGRFASLTFPSANGRQEKRKKAGIEATLATPRKRIAHVGNSGSSDGLSLVDASGRASAALTSLSGGHVSASQRQNKPDFSSEPSSPTPAPRNKAGENVGHYDRLKAFDRSSSRQDVPAMLAVERAGMGRVIVHRELAQQISSSSSSTLSMPEAASSSPSQSRSTDGASSSSSSRSAVSTNATSLDNLGPSPSFSLSSSFPNSEPCSPVHGAASTNQKAQSMLSAFQNHLAHMASSSSETPKATAKADLFYQPRLGGSTALHIDQMPTLDWPDSPTGPWAAASQHLCKAQTERKSRIARWLDEDSGDEGHALLQRSFGDQDPQHHPMVAKVLWDRVRKDALLTSRASMPQLRRTKSDKKLPSSSKKQSSIAKSSKARGKRKTAARAEKEPSSVLLHPPSATSLSQQASHRRSMAALSPLSSSSMIACHCGSGEERGAMICCDGCVRWYHCSCVGLGSRETIKEEHWYCQECSEMIASGVSPMSPSNATSAHAASSLGGSSILGTPSFPRSTAAHQLRPGAGHLPVFAQPIESPMREANGLQQMSLSSALALAPSPQMPSTDSDPVRVRSGGRSRAERVGWHFNEPSSPLDRKSSVNARTPSRGSMMPGRAPTSPSPRSRVPSYDLHDPMSTPFMLGMMPTNPSSTGGSAPGPPELRYTSRDRTPSPRPSSSRKDAHLLATPTRHAKSGRTSDWSGGRHHRRTTSSYRDLDGVRDAADVFSPSRVLQTPTSWGHHGRITSSNVELHSVTTPRNHSREESGPSAWTFSTPTTRAFMDSAFGSASDHNPPSLVYSSSAGGTGGHHLDNGESHSMLRSWQMQSPTSSTRAATRARQVSSERSRTMTSSLRNFPAPDGQKGGDQRKCDWDVISDTDEPPSSSPFPKTPTFSDQGHHTGHHHRYHHESPSSSRGTVSTSSRRLAKLASSTGAPGTAVGLEGPAEFLSRTRVPSSQTSHKNATPQQQATATHQHQQQASATPTTNDFMAGLGLGLDFDDVVNLSF